MIDIVCLNYRRNSETHGALIHGLAFASRTICYIRHYAGNKLLNAFVDGDEIHIVFDML